MILFNSDYLEGCCPQILQRLQDTNLEQTPGYGCDDYCEGARALIRKLCGRPDADVHFLVGGTQTNATVIASALRSHQGVMCAATGHINVHETGAIEHCGHKVIALPSVDGKVAAGDVQACLGAHFGQDNPEHEVQPGMLYISYPTELGTLYTRDELTDLKRLCEKNGIPLFIDGARLGYGLACEKCDLTLQDIASLCDVFYIGGTKQGALFGEAVVICNEKLRKDFRYFIKQGGGMLAKGRLLGLQFETILSPEKGSSASGDGFESSLYFTLAREADHKASLLREGFAKAGCSFFVESFTNQIFPILTPELVARLEGRIGYQLWQAFPDGSRAARFCTSWGSSTCNVVTLLNLLKN